MTLTPHCRANDHDNCPAWMRPFQTKLTPCDCSCHESPPDHSEALLDFIRLGGAEAQDAWEADHTVIEVFDPTTDHRWFIGPFPPEAIEACAWADRFVKEFADDPPTLTVHTMFRP